MTVWLFIAYLQIMIFIMNKILLLSQFLLSAMHPNPVNTTVNQTVDTEPSFCLNTL